MSGQIGTMHFDQFGFQPLVQESGEVSEQGSVSGRRNKKAKRKQKHTDEEIEAILKAAEGGD